MKRASHRHRHAPLRGRDLCSIDDLTRDEILHLFRLTQEMKRHPTRYRTSLDGIMLAMILEKPSLRTRTTFAVGIRQLGGDSIYLSPQEISLGQRESVADVAHNLERMVDCVMIRTFGHGILTAFAEYASIPVINGLTDHEHPCQALADFFTLTEKRDDLASLKLAYIGDGNNVAHSLMLTAAKLGTRMSIATPAHYAPSPAVIARSQGIAEESGAVIEVTTDPVAAAEGADMIYTDTWVSMGEEQEAGERRAAFRDFQVNESLFAHARQDALFMHCLPAHRGEEVVAGIIDSEHSVVFDEAENRLHIEKAIMHEILARS